MKVCKTPRGLFQSESSLVPLRLDATVFAKEAIFSIVSAVERPLFVDKATFSQTRPSAVKGK